MFRRIARKFPELRRRIESVLARMRGMPAISRSLISAELIRECVGRENPVILDIGCNSGGHSRWFAEIFERPVIHSFEPDPRAASRFRNDTKSGSNITLHTIALGARDEIVDFYPSNGYISEEQRQKMPGGWDLSGSIRRPKRHLSVHSHISFGSPIKVKLLTLDTWCRQNDIHEIDFIWMDVQGAEIDVLKGGADILESTRFVYTEYSNKELYEGQANLKQLLEYMSEFSTVVRYSEDVLLRNTR